MVSVLLNMPLLCIGDFNLTPSQLVDSGWLGKSEITLHTPSNATVSTSLEGARLIDLAISTHGLGRAFNSFKQF